MEKLRSQDVRTLCGCIRKMEHLEYLSLASMAEDEMIDMESLSSPPKFLRHLRLNGHIWKFPDWIAGLQNLVKMVISSSKLEHDPLKALHTLPNLLELGIRNDAYYGEKLHFLEGAFPKLKVLYLVRLGRLNSIVMDEGALLNLEMFVIMCLPQLKEALGFQHLRNLKRLGFVEMSVDFLMSQNFPSLRTKADIQFCRYINGETIIFTLQSFFKLQKYMLEHNVRSRLERSARYRNLEVV